VNYGEFWQAQYHLLHYYSSFGMLYAMNSCKRERLRQIFLYDPYIAATRLMHDNGVTN